MYIIQVLTLWESEKKYVFGCWFCVWLYETNEKFNKGSWLTTNEISFFFQFRVSYPFSMCDEICVISASSFHEIPSHILRGRYSTSGRELGHTNFFLINISHNYIHNVSSLQLVIIAYTNHCTMKLMLVRHYIFMSVSLKGWQQR